MNATIAPPRFGDVDSIIDGTSDWGWETASQLLIYLNGVEQKHVLAFNCDEGWVRRHMVTPKGDFVICGIGNDKRIKSEDVRGDVTVKWRDEP